MRTLSLFAASLFLVGVLTWPDATPVAAQAPSAPLSTPGATITLATAHRLITAAEAAARELGVAMTIVVVDSAGQIVAVARMDGAAAVGVTIVHNKAFTAAQFGAPTHVLAGLFSGSQTVFQGLTAVPGVSFIGGGYPVMQGPVVIGAIGVGGGTEEQDMAVAEAALAALR